MPTIFKDEYYDAIRPYMSEEAHKVLDQQIPQIRSRIDGEIDEFAKNLALQIQQQFDQLAAAQKDQSAAFTIKLQQAAANITAAAANPARLQQEAQQLTADVTAYTTQLKTIGETVRKSAATALQLAGVPLPPGWDKIFS
jgi:hypothetical protein